MKSKIYITSLLAVTLLISSCGSLSISQKRYSRGLNIDLFNAKEEKKSDIKAKVATKKTPAEHEVQGETNTETIVAEVTPAENKEMVAFQPEQTKRTNGIASTHRNAFQKIKAIRSIKKQFAEISNARNHNTASQPSDSKKSDVDLELILLIICCFIPILSLIAIYIHDGGITANFWIDLILYLTLVLWVVYALLVILDVIDFS